MVRRPGVVDPDVEKRLAKVVAVDHQNPGHQGGEQIQSRPFGLAEGDEQAAAPQLFLGILQDLGEREDFQFGVLLLGIIQQALQDQGQHALRRRGCHQYRRPGGRQPRSGRRLIIHFLDNAQNVRPRRFGNSPFSMDCHGNCRLRNTGTPGNVLVCHLCHRCYSLIHEDKPESILL